MSFNGFVVPPKNAPLPAGVRYFKGQNPSDEVPRFVYQVSPVIADDHFQMNIGGTVPAEWNMTQIAHYVNHVGPDDSVFAEKAEALLRAKGYLN